MKQSDFQDRLRAIYSGLLRRPLRMALVVIIAVFGAIIDRLLGFHDVPYGVIVVSFGVNSALVVHWVSQEFSDGD